MKYLIDKMIDKQLKERRITSISTWFRTVESDWINWRKQIQLKVLKQLIDITIKET